MKILYYLIILSSFLFAQNSFELQITSWDGDPAFSLAQTSDGGFIVPTVAMNTGSAVGLFKINDSGVVVWENSIDSYFEYGHPLGPNSEIGYGCEPSWEISDIIPASEGGYIMIGSVSTSVNDVYVDGVMQYICSYDKLLYLLKIDEIGNKEWDRIFEHDVFWNESDGEILNNNCDYDDSDLESVGYSITGITGGEGYLIAGKGGCNDDYASWVLKTDLLGNHIWSKIFDYNPTFGSTTFMGVSKKAIEIINTSDEGIAFISQHDDWEEYEESVIIKLNENGEQSDNIGPNLCFNKKLEGKIESMQQTPDGGYICCGTLEEDNDRNMYAIKLDEYGNVEWSQEYGGDALDYGKSVDQTSDGGYIFVGSTYSYGTNSNGGGSRFFLVKTDENGNMIWEKTHGQDPSIFTYDQAYYVEQTSDGGYIMCGRKGSGNSIGNMYPYLIKTDSEGNINSTSTIELSAIKKNLITKLDILGRESTNNKGFQLEIYDDGSVEKKYLIK